MIEKRYPDTLERRTETPIFSHRNHHFYVNKCGFAVVKIENPKAWQEGNIDTAGKTGAPCGACREFMVQLMPGKYKDIHIMMDYEQEKIVTLGELTPMWWTENL